MYNLLLQIVDYNIMQLPVIYISEHKLKSVLDRIFV